MPEICDEENLWQWSKLEIRLNAFHWAIIPQKQFIIIIIIINNLILFLNLDSQTHLLQNLYTDIHFNLHHPGFSLLKGWGGVPLPLAQNLLIPPIRESLPLSGLFPLPKLYSPPPKVCCPH